MSESPHESGTQPPVGIDLGTTYSAIACLDSTGRPTTIPNGSGELLTPSVLTFEDNNVVVGKEAVKSAVFEPHVFADCFKRDMGRQQFRRTVGSHDVPPEILSAFILERLKLDAERQVGPIHDVVVTVPAFFDESRRRATQEAGRLAGLNVLDIINEPTAAAVAYAYHKSREASDASDPASQEATILVYDLGGGTFDVTVLRMNGRTLHTLATDGDVQLGGKDFDERLVAHFAEKFLETHGVDPRSDPHDAAQLWMQAQDTKHTLSERLKAIVPCIHAGIRMRIDVTRADFEQLTSDLLQRTETTTQLVLRQAKLDWAAIDHVLLVGGSSRMPMVVEMLRRITGKEPDRSMSPDEAVAHGAAIYAATLMKGVSEASRPNLQVVNVNSHSLGIIGLDRRTNRRQNVIIIPRNSPLPCRAVRRFATARDNQRSVKVSVVEGESERPEHCIALGECVVRNLPPGLPKNTSVEVEYQYAANGRISVMAKVPSVRQSASVEIENTAKHNLSDLETWRRKLCGLGSPTTAHSKTNDSDLTTASPGQTAGTDELLVKLGEHVVKHDVPDVLKRYRNAAQLAMKNAAAAAIHQREMEKKRHEAVGQSEVIRASADLAQATVASQQAEVQSRFALLSLGRECAATDCWPPGSESLSTKIRHAQRAGDAR